MHLTQDGIFFQLLYIYTTYSNYNRSLKEWKMAGIGSILQHLPTIFFDFSNVLFTLSLNWPFTNLETSWYTSATSPAIKSSVVKFPLRVSREAAVCFAADPSRFRRRKTGTRPRDAEAASFGQPRARPSPKDGFPGYPCLSSDQAVADSCILPRRGIIPNPLGTAHSLCENREILCQGFDETM